MYLSWELQGVILVLVPMVLGALPLLVKTKHERPRFLHVLSWAIIALFALHFVGMTFTNICFYPLQANDVPPFNTTVPAWCGVADGYLALVIVNFALPLGILAAFVALIAEIFIAGRNKRGSRSVLWSTPFLVLAYEAVLFIILLTLLPVY